MVKISGVEKNSLSSKAGFLPDDVLISINDNEINDVLDYRFYITEKKLRIRAVRGNEEFTCSISKPQYDDIGLEFETFLMDKKHTCRNKCVFCFIDQNPKGMREQIYFKDDDSRMSFLYGNYVTLTNMSRKEVDRLIKMRISPINVSVHTTNLDLRCKMLGNRFAGDCLEYLKVFKDGNIYLNCQIVLCKGLNDGKELEKTLDDLAELSPFIESIAIVPAGLTKHRQGLYELDDFNVEDALEVIRTADKKRKLFTEKYGNPLVQCADEWYLKAKIDVPDEEYYGGYPQLDNGVGLIRSHGEDVLYRIEDLKQSGFVLSQKMTVSTATGVAAFDYISKMCLCLENAFGNLKTNVFCIKNDFFGESVTVAGLITGKDLYEQLKGKDLGDKLILPSVMLRHEGDLFLDDMSLEELQQKLGVEIAIASPGGEDFVDMFLNI